MNFKVLLFNALGTYHSCNVYQSLKAKKEKERKISVMDKNKDFSSKKNPNDTVENEESKALVTTESYYNSLTVPEEKDGEDRYYEVFEKVKHKTRLWSVLSIAFSSVSLICSFLGWVGLIIGICGVIFALVSRFCLKFFDTISLVSIIIAIFGIVFGGVFILWPYMLDAVAAFSLISLI